MRKSLLALALLAVCGMANAQNLDVDTNSNAQAGSNSESYSGSASQSGGNTINPNQSVGVGFNQTFEAADIPIRTTTRFKTNNSVPLAAAVSFSSDYCGGTASGGASAAGISIGVAKPLMDGNCQALRRAEKFGTSAANAYNAGMKDMAAKLIVMQVWEICMAGNDSVVSQTAEACQKLALVDSGSLPHEQPAHEQLPSAPQAAPAPQEYQPQQPRGEVSPPSDDKKVAGAHTVRVIGGDGKAVEFEVGPDGRAVGR